MEVSNTTPTLPSDRPNAPISQSQNSASIANSIKSAISALNKQTLNNQLSFEKMVMNNLSLSISSVSGFTSQVNTTGVAMNALAQLFVPLSIQGSPMGAAQANKGKQSDKKKNQRDTDQHSPDLPKPNLK